MSNATFEEIIERQRVVNANFNRLESEAHNLLENNQVALIQLLQNTIDEKLSDLAAEYDMYNADEQMKSLVKKREALNTVFFNQLIVEGILTPDKLTPLLEKMRNYYALNTPGISRNLKETFEIILGSFIQAGDYYAGEFAMILLKYMLRFVSPNLVPQKSFHAKEFFSERIALEKVVTNKHRYFIAICGEKPTMQKFNDNITNCFKTSRNDTRYASMCAFLSCVANIFQCVIAKEKEVIQVDMANVYKFSTVNVYEECVVLPLTIDNMPLNILIGYGDKPNCATITHNI